MAPASRPKPARQRAKKKSKKKSDKGRGAQRWTSEEQFQFLGRQVPEFRRIQALTHGKRRAFTDFWPKRVFNPWFAKWSLTAADVAYWKGYDTAAKGMKTKLKNWYAHNAEFVHWDEASQTATLLKTNKDGVPGFDINDLIPPRTTRTRDLKLLEVYSQAVFERYGRTIFEPIYKAAIAAYDEYEEHLDRNLYRAERRDARSERVSRGEDPGTDVSDDSSTESERSDDESDCASIHSDDSGLSVHTDSSEATKRRYVRGHFHVKCKIDPKAIKGRSSIHLLVFNDVTKQMWEQEDPEVIDAVTTDYNALKAQRKEFKEVEQCNDPGVERSNEQCARAIIDAPPAVGQVLSKLEASTRLVWFAVGIGCFPHHEGKMRIITVSGDARVDGLPIDKYSPDFLSTIRKPTIDFARKVYPETDWPKYALGANPSAALLHNDGPSAGDNAVVAPASATAAVPPFPTNCVLKTFDADDGQLPGDGHFDGEAGVDIGGSGNGNKVTDSVTSTSPLSLIPAAVTAAREEIPIDPVLLDISGDYPLTASRALSSASTHVTQPTRPAPRPHWMPSQARTPGSGETTSAAHALSSSVAMVHVETGSMPLAPSGLVQIPMRTSPTRILPPRSPSRGIEPDLDGQGFESDPMERIVTNALTSTPSLQEHPSNESNPISPAGVVAQPQAPALSQTWPPPSSPPKGRGGGRGHGRGRGRGRGRGGGKRSSLPDYVDGVETSEHVKKVYRQRQNALADASSSSSAPGASSLMLTHNPNGETPTVTFPGVTNTSARTSRQRKPAVPRAALNAMDVNDTFSSRKRKVSSSAAGNVSKKSRRGELS